MASVDTNTATSIETNKMTSIETNKMTSIETNKIIELSECNLNSRALLTGTLLKWMDIIACLAGKNIFFLEFNSSNHSFM